MGLTALIALLAMAALVFPSGEGRLMDALVVAGAGLLAMAAVAGSREHRTYRATLARHWPAAVVFAGFVVWALFQAWSGPDAATSTARARLSLLVFAALGLGALTVAAAALRQGASEAVDTFLGFGAMAGVATLLLATLTDAPLAAPTGLAGVSVLAVFAGLEGYRRSQRRAVTAAEPPPIARRLFLPGATFTACAVALAAAQDVSALAASTAGILGVGAITVWRARATERRGVVGLAAGAGAAGLVLFGLVRLLAGGGEAADGVSVGSALALWEQQPIRGLGLEALEAHGGIGATPAAAQLLAETGVVGVGFALATAVLGVGLILLTPDRERLPSRAGALGGGLLCCVLVSALTSPALAEAAPAFTFACLFGLSAAYGDRKRPSPAAAPQSEPARVGMQRL